MAAQIQAQAALPATLQTVTLDGERYRIRLTWRARPSGGSWYMDLYTAAGAAIALGRRLSPGWGPLIGLNLQTAPPGRFYVSGADIVSRDDLGSRIFLRYYTAAEVAAATGTITAVDVPVSVTDTP